MPKHKTRAELKNAARARFAERLRFAMEKAGFLAGSPTELERLFNAHYHGTPVTVHACRKWLFGEAMPTVEKMATLARALSVRDAWLALGDGDDRDSVDIGLTQHEWKMLTAYRGLDQSARELAEDFVMMLARRQTAKTSRPAMRLTRPHIKRAA